MKMLVVGAALAALVAAPAMAQSHGRAQPDPYSAYGAVTPFGSPSAVGIGANRMNTAREAAIRACSTMAQRYTESTWGNMDGYQYRACMAAQGQAE